MTILMGVLSGSLALIILFTILLIVTGKMRRRLPIPPLIISSLPLSASRNSQDSLTNIESSLIDLDAIRIATMDFSEENKLGEGGFGVVYKGVLEDGLEIAVKRLSVTSKQGLKQLRNEVDLMAKLQHKNLVKLLGCCLKDEEKLLVYEFLPNKSLDKYLSDSVRRQQLEWGTRYRIIEGIGRGLLHLHENPGFRIIHRDLKASNILLDINLEPKISDFGIAKLFKMDQTRGITSQVVGTFGYMSPEYALHGNFSTKSDVYSFGVLVFEILAGCCNSTVVASGTPLDLLSHVWHCWNKGMALKIIDQILVDRYSSNEALRCIHIALLCIQEDPALRPSMSSLLAMLTTSTVALPDPLMPTFLKQVEV
ncbi:cysteine-rich receptor-like protein kinase 10 [Phalaenopsis equestris]|nr:cysteine-rich receptor-like protein kinase 10 [Phalaenopsis equestris]XP_020600278.1 cysteine-rich receptor-like protein kinase 10 [Phalaenopsis equestris]